jgi:hypothetical protein
MLQALATRPGTMEPLGLHTSQEIFQDGILQPILVMKQPREHRLQNGLRILGVWNSKDEGIGSVGNYLAVVDGSTGRKISVTEAGRWSYIYTH